MSTTETDEIIGAAYARLDGALAPPADGVERVAHRIATRRRRRRVARVGVVVVVVAGVAGGLAIARSGDSPSGSVAVDQPPSPHSTLVLTRPDGSTVAFPDVTVSCDPPVANGDQPVENPTPDRIWAYSPIEFSGSIDDNDAVVSHPFVMIQGVLSELQEQRVFELPIEGPQGDSPEPLNVFVADTEGAADGNEVSSSVGDAGTVRVLEASCDPVPVLRLELQTTLGSEEGKRSLDLAGVLR
jgi:hypothetical protein